MSLFRYAAAAALGYYLGQPSGRRQLDRLRERATELWQSPKARELKEKSWDAAGERVSSTVKAAVRLGQDDTDGADAKLPAVPEQSVLDRPAPVGTANTAASTAVVPPAAAAEDAGVVPAPPLAGVEGTADPAGAVPPPTADRPMR